MTPISSFSLIIGTFSNVRAPPNLVISDWGSVTAMSATWSTCMVSIRWASVFVGRTRGSVSPYFVYSSGALCSATRRKPSPSRSSMVPNTASQIRTAFSSMDWNTGSSSPGELEITCSTSDVAVCCSSASERCSRASARSRLQFSSCCSRSACGLRIRPTPDLAFVPPERSLRPPAGLFAPLRAKITSSALVDLCWLLQTSFDHLVDGHEQFVRHGEAEHPGGRGVDDELELARLHDRQIRRLRALEDAPGVHADVAIRIHQARSVAHQPADVGIGTRRIGRGETMMRRQVN